MGEGASGMVSGKKSPAIDAASSSLVAARVADSRAAAQDGMDVTASRVKLRAGVKDEIRGNAPMTADGDFIDPNTGQVIPREGPFDYENDASHFQIEDPSSNSSHMNEML